MTTTQIGSGRPQFILPGGRFDQVTREPLSRVQTDVKTLTPTPELDRLIAGLGY